MSPQDQHTADEIIQIEKAVEVRIGWLIIAKDLLEDFCCKSYAGRRAHVSTEPVLIRDMSAQFTERQEVR